LPLSPCFRGLVSVFNGFAASFFPAAAFFPFDVSLFSCRGSCPGLDLSVGGFDRFTPRHFLPWNVRLLAVGFLRVCQHGPPLRYGTGVPPAIFFLVFFPPVGRIFCLRASSAGLGPVGESKPDPWYLSERPSSVARWRYRFYDGRAGVVPHFSWRRGAISLRRDFFDDSLSRLCGSPFGPKRSSPCCALLQRHGCVRFL